MNVLISPSMLPTDPSERVGSFHDAGIVMIARAGVAASRVIVRKTFLDTVFPPSVPLMTR